MPNSRHTSLMPSPSRRRATKRRRSSVTEHSLHGINTSRQMAKSVTHVSGTTCHLSLRSETQVGDSNGIAARLCWVIADPTYAVHCPSSDRTRGRLPQEVPFQELLTISRHPAGGLCAACESHLC